MELFKILGRIALDNSGANSAMDETTEKASKVSKVFSAVGSAAIAAGKTIGVGLAAGGTAIVALTKKAVDAYADYEQLVGGVETLFKDSAAKVKEYAAAAYETAGLSANEYMSTVTSFSASLLQSLASDTSESGEMAVEAAKESLEKQYEAVQEANEKKIDLLQDSHDEEIEAFEEMTEQKIALIDKQYKENLKLIDEEKYEKIKAIESQIDALNQETEAERAAIEQREQEQKKASLEEKIAKAKTAEDRMEAEQDLADYLADLEQKEREKQRKAQIEELKAQKEIVKEEADAKKEVAKEQYEAEVALVKKQSKEQLKIIKKAQEEELEALKAANKAKLEETKEFIEKQTAMLESSTAVYTAEVYEQAADVANRAVIDMADNANKMGTSMESIQNAYQGFAKQNYTMLDNLKLGYGGTKEEMARLISDAAMMTDIQEELGITVDESSMSFGNIVNAIHIMQNSLGIAGATSDEALGTISGSLNATKAAWTNLVTGMGDDNADMSSLVGKFVEKIVVTAHNLLPRIKTILNGITTMILELVPMISAELPALLNELLPPLIEGAVALLNGVVSALPTLLLILTEQLPFIMTEIGNALTVAFPVLVEMVKELFGQLLEFLGFDSEFATGISDSLFGAFEAVLPPLMSFAQSLIPIVQTLFTTLLPPIMQIVQSLIPIVQKLFDALMPPLTEVVKSVLPLLTQLIGPIMSLIEPIASVIQPIVDCLMALIAPLLEILDMILPPLMVVLDALCTYISKYVCNAITTTANIIKSVLGGFLNHIKTVIETGKKLFGIFIDFFKNVFAGNWEEAWNNIKDMFKTIWDGVVAIFKNTVNTILGAVESMINGAIGSLNAFLSGLNKIVEAAGSLIGLDWHIPEIKEVTIPRLAQGGVLEKGQIGVLEGSGAEAVVPLENNSKWISRVAEDLDGAMGEGANGTLDAILQEMRFLNDNLAGIIGDALDSTSFNINNREFARLVKAVN